MLPVKSTPMSRHTEKPAVEQFPPMRVFAGNEVGQGTDAVFSVPAPLLVGAQGYRKSTFCRILLQPELRFGYTDSIDFKSKQDAERSLGRFFLINIDEFDQISVSQQGFLKHLLQKPVANQ